MKRAVEYAHLRNVNVYVTVNTILDSNEVNEALKYISYLYDIDVDGIINDEKVPARNSSKEYLKKIVSRVDEKIGDECKEGKSLYEKALTYYDFPIGTEIETEDIKDLLNEIVEFYGDTETYGVNVALRTIAAKELRDRGAEIARAFSVLSEDLSKMNSMDKLVSLFL